MILEEPEVSHTAGENKNHAANIGNGAMILQIPLKMGLTVLHQRNFEVFISKKVNQNLKDILLQ